jgi:hypothetical protein
MRLLARVAFFALALPAVLRAAARLAWHERRLPLDELVDRLRSAGPFVLRPLARPEWLLATLDRVLPLLPPRRYGRCLKRSMLLLDLWSRCGLLPRLHLAAPSTRDAPPTARRHEGHAWVTVDAPAPRDASVAPTLATSSEGYPEAFVL